MGNDKVPNTIKLHYEDIPEEVSNAFAAVKSFSAVHGFFSGIKRNN